ncbi:MAG: serine hydrolase domain-containing protein [Actinomycetota bacterium]
MDADLQASIDRIADESGYSGVVHVSRQGRLLYERASGLADRAHGIPNTTDTRFAIASGTKGFTALAVMALVSDGTLTLETSVRDLLNDDLELIDPAVTVEHLLAHTSGIGDYIDESAGCEISDYVMGVPVHRLARAADFRAAVRGRPAAFGVGDRFAYNNSGYVVLALVVEAASGLDYHDVLGRRVFDAAGMASTGFPRSDELPGSAALCYLEVDGSRRTNQLHMPVRGVGDGGAYSTLADLATFWPALFAGAIVPSPIVDEMVRPRNDVPSEGKRYGLGFWLRPDRDTAMLEGYDAGVSFRSAYDPESKLHYTVISNTSEGAWPLVEVLDEMLPGLATG